MSPSLKGSKWDQKREKTWLGKNDIKDYWMWMILLFRLRGQNELELSWNCPTAGTLSSVSPARKGLTNYWMGEKSESYLLSYRSLFWKKLSWGESSLSCSLYVWRSGRVAAWARMACTSGLWRFSPKPSPLAHTVTDYVTSRNWREYFWMCPLLCAALGAARTILKRWEGNKKEGSA